MIARKRCLTRAGVQARMQFSGASRAEAFAGLTPDQVAAAEHHKQNCFKAAKAGRKNPSADHLDPRAQLFCSSIRTSSSAAEHTVDHAQNARVKMFAMHNGFGKPTWWVTVTPDDLHSLKIWDISGTNIKMLSDDYVPTEPPTATLRLKNVSSNPGAAAINFQHVMRVFLEDVLGWDSSRQAPRRSGGLFGNVSAWSYCVETQARGTLHAHCLLWCAGQENLLNRLVMLQKSNQPERVREILDNLQEHLDSVIRCELDLHYKKCNS